jgi:hypothetical protein
MNSRKYNIILNQLPANLKNPVLAPHIGKISIKHKIKAEFYKETYVSLLVIW